MSAAKAACDHMKSLWHGTPEGEWVSMGVFSDGKHYNAPEGVMFSFPGKNFSCLEMNQTILADRRTTVIIFSTSAITSPMTMPDLS